MSQSNAVLAVVAALVLATACSTPPAPSASGSAPAPEAGGDSRTVSLDDTLRVQLGSTIAADGGRLVVTFAARIADSRCPANVTCVWMGDAAVRITARSGGTSVERVLHTGVEPHGVVVERYAVTLVGLLPYPGTEPPAPSVPTVVLRVTR